MASYLILANQTVGGQRLAQTIRDRIAQGSGEDEFYVVVPMTEPEHETSDWHPTQGGLSATHIAGAPSYEALDKARKRADLRLRQMIELIEHEGARAHGEVGSSDPVEAAEDILQRRSFDEVIISTLPARLSRWLKMDLPSRVARLTDTEVTHVEAEH